MGKAKKKKQMAEDQKQKDKVNTIILKHIDFELFADGSNHKVDMFNNFCSGRFAIIKLQFNVIGSQALKLDKHIIKINDSIEAKGYFRRRDTIIKNYNEIQKDLPEDERKPALPGNIKEWEDLLNQESGLKIEKLKINASAFPVITDERRALNVHEIRFLKNYFEMTD